MSVTKVRSRWVSGSLEFFDEGTGATILKLDGDQALAFQPNSTLQQRFRVTAAQVNAGHTILPAIPGYRYQLVDMAMIAIGGNAGGTTGVRLRGTQAASVVTLFDCKVAGLQQHALLRAGTATNGLILNAGASFEPCDTNTALTVVKDGNDLTTATNIDVLVTYKLVAA